jgi:hypothetical protein
MVIILLATRCCRAAAALAAVSLASSSLAIGRVGAMEIDNPEER